MHESLANNEVFPGENAIDRKAAELIVRLDGRDPSPSDLMEVEAWLAEDPRHPGAYLRAEAAWRNFNRLSILHNEDEDAGEDAERASTISRRTMLAAGGAGLALTAAAAAVGFLQIQRHLILTPLGEIRRVPLGDGSVAAVNTDTALTIEFRPDLREVVLEKGEVWFDVAKDKARPFVVTSGDVRIRAVGTAFSVHKQDGGTEVLVTEGVVETWTFGNDQQKQQVIAGSRVFVSDLAGPSEVVVASTEIDRALAWRDGEIALDGETLAEAAAQFNRYNERKLTVDPGVAGERLVGWFHTNEPDTFALAAAAALNLKIVADRQEIHLARGTATAK